MPKIIFIVVKLLLSPCATEDSNNCYWDGSMMGNHHGESYVTLNNVVMYVWRAAR